MKKIHPTYKRTIFIWITASISIFVIYNIITQRSVRQNTNTFFQSPKASAHNTILTPRQEQLIEVQYAIRENNITQAIHSMPTQTAKDFYNRATLKILQAYQLMEQDDITYETILEQAQQDFDTAASKTTNIYLQQKIKNNISLSQNMQYIGDIQTCFTDFNTILDDLASITDTIKQTRSSIKDQLQYIQENTKTLNNLIGNDCQERIQNTFNKSYDALTNTAKAIQQYTDMYSQTLNQYIDDPSLCLQTNLKPIIQDTQSTKKKLKESQQTYAITDMALQAKNLWVLQQMCEQTQDDTLSNQDLEKSLSNLLENLENSVQPPSWWQEDIKEKTEQKDSKTSWPAASETQYIPLTQEEKTLLEQVQQNNEQWINTMMQIKRNDYNPSQTLQTIFEIFYGDTDEFTIPWR